MTNNTDSLCTNFRALAKSLSKDDDPTDKIVTFIGDRLHELHSGMLKFDEVSAECRKVQESNNVLRRQLDVERQNSKQLHEQLDTLRLNEETAKEHQSELETLQRRMGDARKECSKAKDEIQQLQQHSQKREQRLADYKVSVIYRLLQQRINQIQKSVEILRAREEKLTEELKQKVKVTGSTTCERDLLTNHTAFKYH
jgi:chromosome segregation ATPase